MAGGGGRGDSSSLRVIIAPDSFKGTIGAAEVARLISRGWRAQRPFDTVVLLPQADGGEGTLDALEAAEPHAIRHRSGFVTGPDGRATPGGWLEMPGLVAVVELAQMSGLTLMRHPDALGASTVGFGQVIGDALDAGMRRIILAIGGSASTDGGAGALSALGAVLLDAAGQPIGVGGAELLRLARVDLRRLRRAPPDGVILLADVTTPLLGPTGAAAVFGPQKGASPADVALLDAALAQFVDLIGGDPHAEGAGAAGGTAYGFAALWGATIESGAAAVATATGLDEAITAADIVITGEGRFDATSFAGKVTGRVLSRASASGTAALVIAGAVTVALDVPSFSLSNMAGSTDVAIADASVLLVEAGQRAARSIG